MQGNLRLWRANASERSGVKSTKQRQALEYNGALMDRYSHMPEIRRIRRHRHLPQVIKKAGEIKREELGAIKRREENERGVSGAGYFALGGVPGVAVVAGVVIFPCNRGWI